MTPKIEIVVPGNGTVLGEGPHWDAATQTLYFVDILEKKIHKYAPLTEIHTSAVIGNDAVSIIIPVANTTDKFLISIGREVSVVTWDGESKEVSKIEKLAEVDSEEKYRDRNTFNDGKTDATGRLFAGTMKRFDPSEEPSPDGGSLYSFNSRGEVKLHMSKTIGIANGLAWSPDNTKFYYIDTLKNTVTQYDYDINNAEISNGQVIFTMAKHDIEGFLDGMTIDTDGNLWIAVFGGSRVIKVDPRKPETLLENINLPARLVTSVTFGGPNLDELYVTTGCFTWSGVEVQPPVHGAVYRVIGTESKGFPGVSVKLD